MRAGRSAIVVGALATAFNLGAVAEAASYTVRSTVDATRIGVEDQVQLTITLEGSDAPEAVALPTLTNLVVAGGPFQSTQVSIVNGRMTQTRSWTYVLQPQGEGRATDPTPSVWTLSGMPLAAAVRNAVVPPNPRCSS